MDAGMILKAAIYIIEAYRQLAGNTSKLRELMERADAEDRPISDEEIDQVMADTRDAIDRV